MRWTLEQYEAYKAKMGVEPVPEVRPLKYHNVPTMRGAIRFQSKREAAYYDRLCTLKAYGEVLYFLRQVPFDLPGGVKYRIDFMVVDRVGAIHWIDTKGVRTEAYRIKKRQVEALYPVKIEEA